MLTHLFLKKFILLRVGVHVMGMTEHQQVNSLSQGEDYNSLRQANPLQYTWLNALQAQDRIQTSIIYHMIFIKNF